jgi:transcriptional regulator with XRE-family HTH domain
VLVKELRQKKRFSQEQLAEACGLSLRTIQRIESGHRVSYGSLLALAGAFDCDADTLEQEINRVESTSSEYRELPFWLRLSFDSGLFATTRDVHKRLEMIFITLGVVISIVWINNLIWDFARWIPEKALVFGFVGMLIGAYSMSTSLRLGDKYDVWSRLEATLPRRKAAT